MTTDVLLTTLVVMVSLLLLLAVAVAIGLAYFAWRRVRAHRQPPPSAAAGHPSGGGDDRTPWEFRTVSGENITFSLLTPSDLDALFVMESDPRNFRYEREEPLTREEAAEKLRHSATATRLEKAGDYLHPAIRDSSGNFLGTMYLALRGDPEDRSAEIGITLTRSAQRQGHAFEAAKLMMDVAFAQAGLHRVFAEFDTRNAATVRLCEHVGMRREGHFVENRWVKGRWIDTGCYAILQHEWDVVYLS